MLRCVKQQLSTLTEATKSLKKEKAIFIITDRTDMQNICGYIAFVSSSRDSYSELVKKYQSLKGVEAMLIGSYEDGGAVGVQYLS